MKTADVEEDLFVGALEGLGVAARLQGRPLVGLDVLEDRPALGRIERIAGRQDVALDESAVAFVRHRVAPVVDVEIDVGIQAGMAVVGQRVLGKRRIGLHGQLGLDLAEGQGHGQQGRTAQDGNDRFHGHSSGAAGFRPALYVR